MNTLQISSQHKQEIKEWEANNPNEDMYICLGSFPYLGLRGLTSHLVIIGKEDLAKSVILDVFNCTEEVGGQPLWCEVAHMLQRKPKRHDWQSQVSEIALGIINNRWENAEQYKQLDLEIIREINSEAAFKN